MLLNHKLVKKVVQENKKLISLAQQVKEMRRLQGVYANTCLHESLLAALAQEEKVDDMVNDILNQL